MSTQISNFATGLGIYDASLVGGAAQDVSYGQIGTSDLSFNSGYLLNQTPFSIPTASGTGISFTGWFNTSALVQSANACVFDLSSSTTHIALYCSSASATPTMTATFNGTAVGPTAAVAAGWHFFCYTVYNNAGTAVQTLVIDNNASASYTVTNSAGSYAAFTSTALYVGYGFGATFGVNFFNGKVDDFRYYNRVLTSMEMRVLYSYAYSSYGKTTVIPYLAPVVNAPLSCAVIATSAGKYGSAATFVFDNSGTFGNLTVTQYTTSGTTTVLQASAASLVYNPVTKFYAWTDTTYNPSFTSSYSFVPCVVGSIGAPSTQTSSAPGLLYNNLFAAPAVSANTALTYSGNVSAFTGAGWNSSLGWTVSTNAVDWGVSADVLVAAGTGAGIYTGTLPSDVGTYVDVSFGANVPGTTVSLSQSVVCVSGNYLLSFTLLPAVNCASGNRVTVTLGGQTVLSNAVLTSAAQGTYCKYNVPVTLGPTYTAATSLPLVFTLSNGASTTATNLGLGNVVLAPNGALGNRASDVSGLAVYYTFDAGTYTAGTALSILDVSSGTGVLDASMSNIVGLVTFNGANQLTGSSDLSLNGAFVSMVNPVTFPTTGMSVSLWFYPTLTATLQYLYASSSANASTSADANLLALFVNASNQLVLQTGATATIVPVTLAMKNWYHVAVAVTSGGIYTVYLNTVVAYTGTLTYPANVARTYNFLGASNLVSAPFTGQLDEFRLYSRVLSVQDVQGLYHYGVMPLSIFNMVDPLALVIYYPFDQGTDASGVLGNFATGTGVFDTSLNGTVASTGMFALTSRVGSRDLALTSASSQYLSRTVPWTLTNAGIGLSFWIYPTSVATATQYLFATSDSRSFTNTTDPNLFAVYLTTSTLNVQVGTSAYAVTGATLSASTWYHVALNVDHQSTTDASSIYTMYVNGASVSVGGASALVAPYPSMVKRTYTYVGADVSSQSVFYTGQMDDFRLYNRVLTPPEVSVLYADSSFSGSWTTTMPSIVPNSTYALSTDPSDILTGGYTPIVVYDGETVTDATVFKSNFGYLSAVRTATATGATSTLYVSAANLLRLQSGKYGWADTTMVPNTSYSYVFTPYIMGTGNVASTGTVSGVISGNPVIMTCVAGTNTYAGNAINLTGDFGYFTVNRNAGATQAAPYTAMTVPSTSLIKNGAVYTWYDASVNPGTQYTYSSFVPYMSSANVGATFAGPVVTAAALTPSVTNVLCYGLGSTGVDISFAKPYTFNSVTILNKTSNALFTLPPSAFSGASYLWADPSNGTLVSGTKYIYTVTPYVGVTPGTALDVSATTAGLTVNSITFNGVTQNTLSDTTTYNGITYKIYAFMSVGGTYALNYSCPSTSNMYILAVAGGGGGGYDQGGGGGGGGVIQSTTSVLGSDTISIIVGNGGGSGLNGNNTTVKWTTGTSKDITATGGGTGGTFFTVSTSGGSGGGGGGARSAAANNAGSVGIVGQGNAGGNGYVTTGSPLHAGGGGGAGNAGDHFNVPRVLNSVSYYGSGGNGVKCSLLGITTSIYGNYYWGGGGGASSHEILTYNTITINYSGVGGLGGGGGGGVFNTSSFPAPISDTSSTAINVGTSGTTTTVGNGGVNTGGGGGGGSNGLGRLGGSGIVIIAIPS